jgi:superfamily II DNA/RNA helicase
MINILRQLAWTAMKIITRRLTCGAALVCLLSAVQLAADTIHLTDGRTIRGTIIAQDGKSIRIKTGGKEQVILKSTVRRITYDEKKSPEQEAEDERLEKEQLAKEDAEREKAESERRDQLEKLREENEALKGQLVAGEERRKQADAARQQKFTRAGWPSVWRSFVVPGWGQFYRGDAARAAGFMTAAGISAYYVYRLNQTYQTSRDHFNQAQNLSILTIPGASSSAIFGAFTYANGQRNEMHNAALRANFAAAILVATFAFSGADSLFYRSESQRLLAEDLSPRQSAPELSIAATLRF